MVAGLAMPASRRSAGSSQGSPGSSSAAADASVRRPIVNSSISGIGNVRLKETTTLPSASR